MRSLHDALPFWRGPGGRLRGGLLLPAGPAHGWRGEDPLAAEARAGGVPDAALAVAAESGKVREAPLVSRPPPAPLPFSMLRSEEHTSELQSLMRISYAVFCLKKKKKIQ